MTNKELIKQEIERRYNCEKCYPLDREANVAAAVLRELLLFIDSLPEQPASEDLEEYAKKLTKGAALDKHNLIWMCKKGAEWQKQQMMKDAVDGEVVYQIGSSVIAPTDIRYKIVSDRVYIPNVKLGDKVKIIIIKSEQQ